MELNQNKVGPMRAYLLGLLADEEAASFEGAYFADRDLFLELQSEEKALIADYLEGALQPEDRRRFESRYLQLPDLQRKVEKIRRECGPPLQTIQSHMWLSRPLAFVAVVVMALGLGLWTYHEFTTSQNRQIVRSSPAGQPPIPPSREESSSQVDPRKNSFPKAPQSRRVHQPRPETQLRESLLPVSQATSESSKPAEPHSVIAANLPPAVASMPRLGTTTAPHRKMRVAVMDFDYGIVKSSVVEVFGFNQDVGEGIANLLVRKLAEDGKYAVIERRKLDRILQENNFSASDRADPPTAARIGRLLGVDAVVIGSVTQFGPDHKSTAPVSGLLLSRHAVGLGMIGIKRNPKAICNIAVRMVDTSTGEIVAAVNANGQSLRSGSLLLASNGGEGTALNMHSTAFQKTMIGEAVIQSILTIGADLDAAATNLPPRKFEASGLVADVDGNVLILNINAKSGLRVGDKLEISRPGPTEFKVGEAVVTEIDADSSTVRFNGTEPPQVGDIAKTPR